MSLKGPAFAQKSVPEVFVEVLARRGPDEAMPTWFVDALPDSPTCDSRTLVLYWTSRLVYFPTVSECGIWQCSVMAMQQPSPTASAQALLARLANRPGVQSTLILSRDTGAIVRSSGLVLAEDAEVEEAAPTANGTYLNATETNGTAQNGGPDGKQKSNKGTRKAEEVASLVWRFMKSVGEFVEELNGEGDEGKLIRVRTKKNEVVVVPEGRFLLCVIHETPAA
ncbi:hypothetical protein KC331_g9864 [Hortaea werneckii]|nr:hypothetical protein KC331_g9864 [Hortaea werneckii]KAI7708323.1 hypothetical protein KC353_g11098 [Hortaea werneckii]